jgi:hypothetical protein
MATIALARLLRVGFGLLAVASLLVGRAAAVPHVHAGADEARHARLPPHFHLSWLYGSGSHALVTGARHAPPFEARGAWNSVAIDFESDAVFLIEVGQPPATVDAAGFSPAETWRSLSVGLQCESLAAGRPWIAAPPLEPATTELYFAVRRLRI